MHWVVFTVSIYIFAFRTDIFDFSKRVRLYCFVWGDVLQLSSFLSTLQIEYMLY